MKDLDRETVITHLQIIHTWAEFARERDLQFFTAKHLEDIAQWSDDALALLKEQEAVYPSWQNGKMYCGHCGSKFPPRVMMRFCHRCGVPIKLKVNDIVEQEGR